MGTGWGSSDTLSGSPTRLRQVRSFSHFLPELDQLIHPGLDLGMAAVKPPDQRRDIATREAAVLLVSLLMGSLRGGVRHS